MRLFPSDWDKPRPSHTDKTPVPADNNPANDSPTGGYTPDQVAGTVFPYRGQEMHGVVPDTDPWQRKEDYYDTTGSAETEQHDAVVAPVPVRIVTEFSQEVKNWNGFQTSVGGSPREIIGRNLARTRVRIKNLAQLTVVYIGRSNSATVSAGYPLDPGEALDLWTSDEIHGVSADGTTVYIGIVQEFTSNADGSKWH